MHTKRVAEMRAELPDLVKQALSRVVWPLVMFVATTIVMAYNRWVSILENRMTFKKRYAQRQIARLGLQNRPVLLGGRVAGPRETH
jgi:hypothetical protein